MKSLIKLNLMPTQIAVPASARTAYGQLYYRINNHMLAILADSKLEPSKLHSSKIYEFITEDESNERLHNLQIAIVNSSLPLRKELIEYSDDIPPLQYCLLVQAVCKSLSINEKFCPYATDAHNSAVTLLTLYTDSIHYEQRIKPTGLDSLHMPTTNLAQQSR